MLATTSVKTNFCPKHSMRPAQDITADSKPFHLNGLRYDKSLFMPTSTSTLKPLSERRVAPSSNHVLRELPNGSVTPMVAAPRKALMDESSTLDVKPRALDENFLVSSQRELKDRVKSIEKTLDRFGSRASLRSVGSEARTNPASARNSSRTMPVYKPDKHIHRTQPPSYTSSQRVSPTKSTDSWKKRSRSKSPLTFWKSDFDDDEEIASLFRELETLRTPGSIAYDEPPSYRSKTPNTKGVGSNNTLTHVPMGSYGRCGSHGMNSIMDLNSTHHSVIGINNGQLIKGCNLPCLFRCKGCGDLQPIFTPYNNFGQFHPTLFGSGTQTSPAPTTNPSPYPFNSYTMNPMYNQIPSQTPTNPQIIFMPYYAGMPAPNNQTTPELAEILKTLSENFPKNGKRSVGTQSVEDLSQKNLDVSEEEIGVINKNDNLQSAANELFFDDDFPDESNDNMFGRVHNARTALELRELELSAWAAAKWWNFIKQKREEKRQAALDIDFEDFCRAEFPNREKLQSALDDLEFTTNEVSPRNELGKEEMNEKANQSYGLPQGFTSFKQLSATAKASYKWAEYVEKKKRQRREQGIV